MKPIRYKDTGSAVEDIQRRLRVLGYEIGSDEGARGVFLTNTLAAVKAFQQSQGIEVTGAVGPRTWSALVDSTFELGDRMLYLRMPYFHGADVTQLQRALNSLGFAAGDADGIFGTNTERAVSEFQLNYDINPDGLVGNDTLRALFDLRHIWGTKEGTAHSSAEVRPRQHYSALQDYYFDFQVNGNRDYDFGIAAALRRIVRYANNLEDAARVNVVMPNAPCPDINVLVSITACVDDDFASVAGDGTDSASTSRAAADSKRLRYQHNIQLLAAQIQPILSDSQASSRHYELSIEMPLDLLQAGTDSSLPVGLQLIASRLLDALCLAAIG